MNTNVVIIDFGSGNVSSVERAIKQFTRNCELTSNPQKIIDADRLILPGDGAFGDSMKQLKQRNLIEPIKKYIDKGKPFLGICVGMQILATSSEEFGFHQGLDYIPGRVVKLPQPAVNKHQYKIPQIGWNTLIKSKNKRSWKGTIFEDIKEGNWVYFIHSYVVVPEDDSYNLAFTNYGGNLYSSAVVKKNISACQFHPEKSATVGLKILEKFIKII